MPSSLPKLLVAALCFVATATAAKADTINLAWNSNADPNDSYKVYYSETSGVYDLSDDAHHQTTKTVFGLKPGHTASAGLVQCSEK